jgi:uncharacterized membrane protein
VVGRGTAFARRLHWLFEAGILLKGIFAFGELVAGCALLVVGSAGVQRLAEAITFHEISEDPSDPLAMAVLKLAHGDSVATNTFFGLYLGSHGLIKLVTVLALWLRIPAAYPLAMIVFAGFIVYQMHRYATTHSPAMLALSVLDVVVIWLTWREWRTMRQEPVG